TMAALREALRAAPVPVLQKLAVDITPSLFRNDYSGEARGAGERWADALAKPRMTALPSFLVRVYRGAFNAEDADELTRAMQDANVAQAALVFATADPVLPDVREKLTGVPWIIDRDGLINLMVNANIGVTSRVYEARYVDPAYFR
ncbi:MAG TPA: hypothetical protein VHK90_12140, partial [Thermoanaerobaculia bacterium]|nr:hypothetical protein [Thermoanaerobaculia bacterium]